jgi:hypothetical protein
MSHHNSFVFKNHGYYGKKIDYKELFMKAMNLQKKLISAAVLTFGFSGLAHANIQPVGFSFTTVPDVSISPSVPLSFGADLRLATGTTCTLLLDDTSANRPGFAAARLGDSAITEGADFQTRSGDCDPLGAANTTGTVGVYDINGANGVSVAIDVNPILPNAANFFSFVPTATAATYDGAGNGDTLAAFTLTNSIASNGATAVLLASPADTGPGSPIPGQTKLFVGGTLTAQQQLTAGTTYNLQTFTVDVVYN